MVNEPVCPRAIFVREDDVLFGVSCVANTLSRCSNVSLRSKLNREDVTECVAALHWIALVI